MRLLSGWGSSVCAKVWTVIDKVDYLEKEI
jgi:hypothetical protein